MSGNTTIPGPHGTTIGFSVSGGVTAAIAAAFANDLAILNNEHLLVVKEVAVKGGHVKVPTVPAGKTLELVVTGGTAGQTVTLSIPASDSGAFIINESDANLVIDASKDPNVLNTGTGATTYFGGAGNGVVGAGTGAGNQYFQALASGGGNYAIGYSTGNNTVWASSGNDLVQAGSGSNLVGLGSGNDTVVSSGTDTILASTGNATVFGHTNDLVFGNVGSLLFVDGGAGTTSTVVAGSGAAMLFGTGGSDLVFLTTGSLQFADPVGGSDTIVAASGASSIDGLVANGGSVVLFSSANGNQLVAGAGNATLNALGTTGTNALWGGSGADSLFGGTGANIFAFVAGGASVGGNDTVGNWTAKDTLALLGYTANQISQATVGGSAVITLSDGTKITIAGVPHIANIIHS